MKNNRFLKEFKKVIIKAPYYYLYKLFVSIALRGLLLISPLLLSGMINELTKGDYEKTIYYFIFLSTVIVLYRLFECFNQHSYYLLYNKLHRIFYDEAVEVTNHNSLFSLSRFNMGEYTNIVINDVNIISAFYTNIVIRIVQFFEFIFIYYYFYRLNIYLFIFVILFSIIVFIVSLKTTKKLQRLNENVKANYDGLLSSTNEYFMGLKEIKSFNIFEDIFKKMRGKANSYLESNRKYTNKSNYFHQFYLLIWELLRLGSLFFGFVLFKEGKVEIGVILIIYNYYQKIIDNFSMILTINLDYRMLNVSLGRLNKIYEFSKPKNEEEIKEQYDIKGSITFDKVLYGYKHRPILKNTSFKIKENSITVFTTNQSGKTTGIFDLLLKLNRQHEGKILIDNVDINDIDDYNYFKLLSITREEPFFFSMSIKDNLLLIEEDEEKIMNIAQKIGLDEYVNDFEMGYDTILNNNYSINSVIKQLVSLVRMFIKGSKIMLFDDSLDVLDTDNRKKVIKLLTELAENHTIIISTHNDDIKNIADKVINIK